MSDEFIMNEPAGQMTGVGGKHTWVFQGVTEGSTNLVFRYFRPWEEISTAVSSKTFTLQIAADGTILGVR